MIGKYNRYKFREQPTFILKDGIEALADVDVVVFDCDGVLLDIQAPYWRAVKHTTSVLLEAFTGTAMPTNLLDDEINYAYKCTGGFNNDWALTYALVMRILDEAPEDALIQINRVASDSLEYASPRERLKFIRENSPDADIPLYQLSGKLKTFAERLDDTGVEAVNKLLSSRLGGVARALGYGDPVGKSVLSTLFEESFSGALLFRDTYGISPQFTSRDKGYVEDARLIVMQETLENLFELLGGERFGIASGSLANVARYALGKILDRFKPDTQVWHDDVERAAGETGRRNLHKPNPYSLITAAKPYEPYSRVLYIGDTIADRLMVERAGNRYLFAGVYRHTASPVETMTSFIERGCEVVTPTINELPRVMKMMEC